MLVDSKELLIDARRNGNALGHFNVFNFESSKAVISAIGKTKQPSFVAITETTIKYAGLNIITSIVKELAKSCETNFIMHLDHGKSLETIKRCIEAGFTSIMIDGSAFHFEENVEITKKVIALARPKGISIEAELGHVGRVGEVVPKHFQTRPDRAEEFVELTKVDSLAVAVGTIHGLVTKMDIDYERLKKIVSRVKIPLVIHGGTGLKDKEIRDLISNGVTKINMDTALRIAFMRGLKQNIVDIDPRKALTSATDEVELVVEKLIKKFHSPRKIT
jgi:ketose-bisphosphate aldolase